MRAKSGIEIFRRQGLRLIGIWTRPLATTPRFPAVLFLHGFPGAEKNVDIQRALLERGIASFALHFRGSWGSEGTYRFSHLLGDARAALGRLRRLEGVDERRLAVFGFSMGGWTAIHLAARERVRAVAAVAPVGGAEMLRPGTRENLARLGAALRIDGADSLYRDFSETVRRLDPARSAARLKCPLLLVHGRNDEIVPCGVSERIYAAARGPKTRKLVGGAFHDFLEQRAALSRIVSRWLSERLRA